MSSPGRDRGRTVARGAAMAAAVLMAATAARAAPGCPAAMHGQPLAEMAGARVYFGDPADKVELLPNQHEGSQGWWNEYLFDDSSGVIVVCRYRTGEQAAYTMPPGVKSCRQDARSFACR